MRRARLTLIAIGVALLVPSRAGAEASAPAPVPLVAPVPSSIPAGALGDAIRLGQRIVTATQATSVKAYVGNGLTCANCHLDAGRQAYAAPLVGLTGLFPEYESRSASVVSLEERMNQCFERSMNGRKLPSASPEMVALLAYTAWLSQGVPTGTAVVGRGFQDVKAPEPPDPGRGKALYAQKCAACHGANGQGTPGADGAFVFPPLWGPKSFNDGAGMARTTVAAAFVQTKMPLGNAGSLSDQDAYDIAAYFTAQPRPKFVPKARDWPRGERPADAR
jgi:thiosulfate dehydrogenase